MKTIFHCKFLIFFQWFFLFVYTSSFVYAEFVGNKAKEQISKRMFQQNKAYQIFQKKNISYLLIRTRTFALLPTNWMLPSKSSFHATYTVSFS